MGEVWRGDTMPLPPRVTPTLATPLCWSILRSEHMHGNSKYTHGIYPRRTRDDCRNVFRGGCTFTLDDHFFGLRSIQTQVVFSSPCDNVREFIRCSVKTAGTNQ